MRYSMLCVILLWTVSALAAEGTPRFARWEADIRRFEVADQAKPPAANGILFAGSSSIRLWNVERSFPQEDVLNRGFGGSKIADIHHFAERVVIKYRPRVIVFYAGDNDIAAGQSAAEVFEDFKAFSTLVAEKLPDTELIYLPIKPSLARWKLWPTMQQANSRIREYLATVPRRHYADIATPMLGENGKPRAELFARDGLHLSDQGYELWSGVVKALLDNLRAAAQPKKAA
jgi:lysophospholipase L1-like esterase